MDLTGKTMVILINDPPIPDPNDPSRLDRKMVKGNAMTYYDRWTYKYEMAAKLGAAAALIVHETKPAAYPYSVVVNNWSRDVEILGDGNSTLDDMVTSLAAEQGRVARAESRPELGLFYRADHFEFAKQGVPVMYMKSRTQYIGKPGDYAKQKVDEYIVHDYHQVTDTVRDDWDLSDAVEDKQLLLELGYRIAQADTYPQ